MQISGNDLRFGPILTSCILNWAGRVGKALGADQKDCDWSKAKFRADIASAIETNGSQLESLYKDLQAASPTTQLYAVGYPLFVKQVAVCWNVPTLSAAEQEFIIESIKYVNQTIKSAAARANIRYIDIQDALGDQAMCGKGGAMTDPLDYVSSGIMAALKRGETVDQIAREYGLVDPASKMLLAALYNNIKNAENTADFAKNPLVNLASVIQQLSHPNAEGHQLIANKIIDAISEDGSILAASCDDKVIFCPNDNNMVEPIRPTYFGPALTRTGIVVEIASAALDNTVGVVSPDRSLSLIDGIVAARRSAEVILRLMPSFGMSLSNVHAVLHSDDFDLGDLTTDPQGGYSARVTIPASIPVGMHIIEVTGTTTDGKMYKALTPAIIVGALKDEDADGKIDREDDCLYSLKCMKMGSASVGIVDSGARRWEGNAMKTFVAVDGNFGNNSSQEIDVPSLLKSGDATRKLAVAMDLDIPGDSSKQRQIVWPWLLLIVAAILVACILLRFLHTRKWINKRY